MDAPVEPAAKMSSITRSKSTYCLWNKQARREQSRLWQRANRAKKNGNSSSIVDFPQDRANEPSTERVDAAVQTDDRVGSDALRMLMCYRVHVDVLTQKDLLSIAFQDHLIQGVGLAQDIFDLFDVRLSIEQTDFPLVHSTVCIAQHALGRQVARLSHKLSVDGFKSPSLYPRWKLPHLIFPPDEADMIVQQFYGRLHPLRQRTAHLIESWNRNFDPHTMGLEDLNNGILEAHALLHQWTILCEDSSAPFFITGRLESFQEIWGLE
ncbi:hypothetical protein BDP27DRAFT_1370204 [Rhodocollybia butyracea]|uniref:Uncharacterized protein n=1 Tax=Rhodocollybia butyracea TaxID=206335 RepID=A0A9P5TYT3_9AGAR|nr:hypothetical protein BDP27DRAFT_1370204 [Rhodocollybia butyracea]